MAEAGHGMAAAVDARKALIPAPAAELNGFGDDGGEIFVLADVDQTGIGDHFGGEDAVRVRGLDRHQAVRGEEYRRGYAVELPLLVLPGGAEIAFEVRVLFQFRVGVRRQHFTVRVDIDALARALVKQQFQVAQVVAADDDEGALFDLKRYGGRFRRPKGAGVRPV